MRYIPATATTPIGPLIYLIIASASGLTSNVFSLLTPSSDMSLSAYSTMVIRGMARSQKRAYAFGELWSVSSRSRLTGLDQLLLAICGRYLSLVLKWCF